MCECVHVRMLITVWLLFDEFMGHVVLNDVLCVSSGALYTTHVLCGWLRDTDKECCCPGDSYLTTTGAVTS